MSRNTLLVLAGIGVGLISDVGVVHTEILDRGDPEVVPGRPEPAVVRFGDCAAAIEVGADLAAGQPPYLQRFADRCSGNPVVRVTDPEQPIPGVEGRWGRVARHHYSLDQAWNADQTLLALDRGTKGNLFLDGQTYQPLFRLDPPGENRWHPTEPDLQIYVKDNVIGLWNVRSGATKIVGEFSGYSELKFGSNKGNPSDDGGVIAVVGKDQNGRSVAFAYDIEQRTKYPDVDLSNAELGYVTISPRGDLIVFKGKLDRNEKSRGDATAVFDLQGNRVGPYWSEYGCPSHADLTVDENGDQVAVGICKSDPYKSQVVKRRLRDGRITPLTRDKSAVSHASARNIRRPGWVYLTYGHRPDRKGWAPYAFEIIALRIDGSGELCRLAKTRAARNGYLSEAHASPSPDGTRVIWASNWADRKGPIASYVVHARKCGQP